MARSVFSRFWDAVKPPPRVSRAGAPRTRLTARQKRLLYVTAAVFAVAGVGLAGYAFVASAPQRAEKQYQSAMKKMAAGNYTQAVAGFTSAIGIWPLPAAYLERGVSHVYLGQAEEAIADLDQAIALDPSLARAYSARGSIYRARGDSRRALEDFNKSIEISPNLDAYFERGKTYEDLGDHQKAIADFDQAIAQMRDAPYLYRARSLARRNLGDVEGFAADQDAARTLEHRR
jgi:tetratricopeptide (TPR) repeat protein